MSAWLLRSGAAGAALLVLLFALVAYRVSERGTHELGASDVAFDAGQLDLAVEHARRAAAAYVPGAPHVRLGFERLYAVARGAERARDLPLARRAWRAVRAAAIESGHLWQPHAAELADADRELGRLAGQAASAPASLPATAPSAPQVLGLLLGGALALGGLLAAASRHGDDDLSPSRQRKHVALVSCLIGAVIWSAALLGA